MRAPILTTGGSVSSEIWRHDGYQVVHMVQILKTKGASKIEAPFL